jgi:hypothetical protein
MIELALTAMLFGLMAVAYSQYRQQENVRNLFDSQPTVTDVAPRPARKLTEGERRIILLIDDSETLFRQILTRKPHSRAHCVRRLGFSEYRWNRAMRLLKHLKIFDGRELLVSYREARQRIRRHFDSQMKLARASAHFVPSV